jgi:hypothetical protein
MIDDAQNEVVMENIWTEYLCTDMADGLCLYVFRPAGISDTWEYSIE